MRRKAYVVRRHIKLPDRSIHKSYVAYCEFCGTRVNKRNHELRGCCLKAITVNQRALIDY